MRKLPAVLALYQTDECMDMIAEVLEDRNAFPVTYIPLDSEDILPRPQILIRTSFSWKYPRLSQSGKSGRQWRSDGRSASGHTLSSSFWGLLRTGRLSPKRLSGPLPPDTSPLTSLPFWIGS